MHSVRRWGALAAGLVVALFAIVLLTRGFVVGRAESQLMELRPNGAATPATYGASFRSLWFQSGGRRLQASVTEAPPSCPTPTALLIYHGKGETISDWAQAQAFLSGACVSSVVFDYSGHGSSAPPAHIATLNQDAAAAYSVFVRTFPHAARRCILGHSMGNAPMLHALPALSPAPACVIVSNGFTSVKEIAAERGAAAPVLFLLNGVWDNVPAVKKVRVPMLVIHSDTDEVIPPAMGERLARAAPCASERAAVHGFGHNALYEHPSSGWWNPVLEFIADPVGCAVRTG
jgi:uncharacterized protein